VPPCHERCNKGTWESSSAEAPTGRGAQAAPGWYLRGPAVPDSAACLGLTSNQVFGLAKTDEEWSTTLEAALTASRRSDLKHGTNAAYVAGCVCKECRAYQSIRMGRRRD
jgi:hypothetical protein